MFWEVLGALTAFNIGKGILKAPIYRCNYPSCGFTSFSKDIVEEHIDKEHTCDKKEISFFPLPLWLAESIMAKENSRRLDEHKFNAIIRSNGSTLLIRHHGEPIPPCAICGSTGHPTGGHAIATDNPTLTGQGEKVR